MEIAAFNGKVSSVEKVRFLPNLERNDRLSYIAFQDKSVPGQAKQGLEQKQCSGVNLVFEKFVYCVEPCVDGESGDQSDNQQLPITTSQFTVRALVWTA